ncbi:AAA family ATPase [Actinoplanes sp. Pm04-4]|uniref:AAA family ATPase n=1 Tax=Paractinoplanes pyxinae TaxID=2997416 RepID=A0ABT4BGF9_9ACTN|nr:helix-turn-helix transcriptional regulator [Actinoplanes pyxinae]MCY1145627.1 AAA family ATPase [Actinoplanes pyxinae]
MAALMNRETERESLDRLLDTVRSARSQALIVRGDPGVGKTALLDYLTGRASEFRVLPVSGVQSQMELAYAALHLLVEPILHRLDEMPAPQRTALRTALGLSPGPAPDRFLVGLALLTLLSDAAGDRPLICVVDDEQWLDQASAQALGFVARRLAADPVGLVFGAREPSAHLTGLPVLDLGGLDPSHARELLDANLSGPLDDQVRDRIVTEAQGNPLALLELPRSMTTADFAGGFGLPAVPSISLRLEEGFLRRMEALPAPSRRLLQLAAADPSGDPVLVHRAARRLGIPPQAAMPAAEAHLLEFTERVHFRHPLVRSVAYRSASEPARREMHAALAEVTDPASDPDRRAWHRAQSVSGTDEQVAAELERSAERAQSRGGLAAAAAFREQLVRLTPDPARHAERALAAAGITMASGAFGRALELLDAAAAGPLPPFAAAQADQLRARITFVAGVGEDALAVLIRSAERLTPLDPGLARVSYLEAIRAASFAGRMTGPGSMTEIAYAARALPAPADPGPTDRLLDALATIFIDGPAAAAPALRRVAREFAGSGLTREDGLAFGWLATAVIWDDDAAYEINARQVAASRATGALDQLPLDLVALALSEAWRGDFASAEAHMAETAAICEITGSQMPPSTTAFLAALRGDPVRLAPHVEALHAVAGFGQQSQATYAHWVSAVLASGHGRHADAYAEARLAVDDNHVFVSLWALPQLIEAAVKVGAHDEAARALDQLTATTHDGTDFGRGQEALGRALLAGDFSLYVEAIELFGRAGIRTEQARARLLLGEWLRAEGRLDEARASLREAREMFEDMGMAAYADRARRELMATGERAVRRRKTVAPAALTDRESLIAWLAADGLSNPEIGAQLFLSARTVEWHLGKVFGKLGATSRTELAALLGDQRT